MPAMRKCRGCGAEIPGNAPFGHCPNCLLGLGFGPSPDETGGSSPPDASGGRTFGEYELLEQIGRGGMGVIYKARQLTLNRLVALKMINAGELASPTMIQRFHLEAESAANLHHPNIVPIYETGEHQGQHFFSMELIDGVGLDRHITGGGFSGDQKSAKEKPSPRGRQEQIARIMAKVARAVDYAHQHGILHRDIKPSNVLLDHRGEPRLTDFGLAKVVGHTGSGLTASGAIMGTPSYMAPEQAAGEGKRVTIAADIYGLGAVLYAMLTGHPPFHAETPVQTLKQVVEDEPKHPTTFGEGIDHDLATICMKCLEKEPQQRYSSATALAEDLERWLRKEPIHARPAATGERFWRWCRRNPRVAVLGASVAVLLVAIASLSTVVAIRFASKNEDIRAQARQVELEAKKKREALEVLQRKLIHSLEQMWVTANQKFVTIDSDELAALRGELSAGGQTDTNRLNLIFAVYTHEKPTTMQSNIAPVLAILERSITRSLSRPVQIDLRIYRQYDVAKDALVRGEVDFARFGSASYVEAKKLNPQVSLLLAQNGKVRGYIFALADSGIRSLTDLKGKSVAFVDDSSTTGNFLPKRALFVAGLTAKDLRGGSTNFLGSHDSVVKAVVEGKFGAGACNASIVDKFMKDTGIKFHILNEDREAKGLPWVAGPTLDPAVAESIRGGLRSIRAKEDQAVLERLRNETTGFEKAEDADYNPIRDAMREAGKFDGGPPRQPATP